ncbi:MAG: glycosyltransferase family 4 protein [Pirellulaceae bacterium]
MQVDHTRRALETLGVEITLCDPWHDSLSDVDVCHLFTTGSELYSYAQLAKQRGIPLVVSPVMNTEAPLWQTKLKLDFLSRLPGVYTQLRQAREIVASADAVLPLTDIEKHFLASVFRIPAAKMVVVPNGVESRFSEATPDLFVNRFGFRPDVLFVGRIDRNKNVLSLIEAIRGTGLKLAVIGFPHTDEPQMFGRFQHELGQDVIYIGRLAHMDPLLASAYAATRVFCLPSFKEVMPLTVLEALAAGSRVVLTKNSAMNTLLGDSVYYVDPHNPKSIRMQLLAAHASEKPFASDQWLLENFTWEHVGRSICDVYTNLLAQRMASNVKPAIVD